MTRGRLVAHAHFYQPSRVDPFATAQPPVLSSPAAVITSVVSPFSASAKVPELHDEATTEVQVPVLEQQAPAAEMSNTATWYLSLIHI